MYNETIVLKFPKNKPPFIGVLYLYVSFTPTDNHDLILNPIYKNAEYQLELEFIRNFVNIKLVCREHLIIREYLHQTYNPDEMKRWLQLTRGQPRFNFGHVVKENDKHMIMRTISTQKPVFFKVTSLVLRSLDRKLTGEGMPY